MRRQNGSWGETGVRARRVGDGEAPPPMGDDFAKRRLFAHNGVWPHEIRDRKTRHCRISMQAAVS